MAEGIQITRLGEKLKALRKKHGFTLTYVTQALGFVAHSHLSAIENGKKLPSLEMTVAIAKFYNVTTDALLLDEIDL